MLVLALQFSKGDAQRLPASWDRSDATIGALDQFGSGRCGSGAQGAHAVRGASDPASMRTKADSLKTEEKTKSVDLKSRGGRILRLSTSCRPTHQCTNWELVRTGPDECRPTIEQCSLERR
jgi:hypothetical protein